LRSGEQRLGDVHKRHQICGLHWPTLMEYLYQALSMMALRIQQSHNVGTRYHRQRDMLYPSRCLALEFILTIAIVVFPVSFDN